MNGEMSQLKGEPVEEQQTGWVQAGRIMRIDAAPGGGYLVMIWSTRAEFAARNLGHLEVLHGLRPRQTLSYDDTGEVYYAVEMTYLPDFVETGAPVMLRVDEQDGSAMDLYPDALCQEGPYLPYELHLVCPLEHQGRWLRRRDHSVYECACGAIWDVAPEDGEEPDDIWVLPDGDGSADGGGVDTPSW